MATIHAALQSVVKYFNPSKANKCVDDFRLSQVQYKVVFGALVTCAILSGLTNWYSRIDCSVPELLMADKKYVEEWCYSNSTFLVDEGEDGYIIGNQFTSSAEAVYHLRYYQWVTLALLLQAACFQIPRLLWKSLEGGRVRKVVGRLADLSFETGTKREHTIRSVAIYFNETGRKQKRRRYFYYFALCQCLYLINVIAQICFTQAFLDNEFLNLLPELVQGSPTWNRLFPKAVKCNVLLQGPSGISQMLDISCVLAMNVFFEKLYLVVWVLLAVALCTAIAQNYLVFRYMITGDSDESDTLVAENPSERLLLSFLETSLDPVVYTDFANEVAAFDAQVV